MECWSDSLYFAMWSSSILGRDGTGCCFDNFKGVIDFKREPWPQISDNAKSLVRQMLEQDPRKQLIAQQVLVGLLISGVAFRDVCGTSPQITLDLLRVSSKNYTRFNCCSSLDCIIENGFFGFQLKFNAKVAKETSLLKEEKSLY
ncbi:unnamed protein product, partial [Vitis vinifera]|uniref:Uncharacterized protein n=1 Tax=Vitis vinifera TaxID=29760 RepID=E0CTQ8_VITVI